MNLTYLGGKKGQYDGGEDEVRRLAESRLYLVLQTMVGTLDLFKERWRSQHCLRWPRILLMSDGEKQFSP